MSYVALVPLKLKGRQVKAGDLIPEANEWQESVIRAHLNIGWMRQAEYHEIEPVAVIAAPTKKKSSKKKGG
jgi:hypothetical protein